MKHATHTQAILLLSGACATLIVAFVLIQELQMPQAAVPRPVSREEVILSTSATATTSLSASEQKQAVDSSSVKGKTPLPPAEQKMIVDSTTAK